MSEMSREEMLFDIFRVVFLVLTNPQGFVLFVEGGRIDHAHHDNLALLALDETIALAEAVEVAEEMITGRDTLFLLTADHSHVMSYNGYAPRGTDILGPAQTYEALDKLPYMTLSYSNGPGARAHIDGVRPDVTLEEDYETLHWMSHADVPIEWETHGGEDVAVFARGPHHKLFTGLYEQSAIPHRIAYAACIGPAGGLRRDCNYKSSGSRLIPLWYAIFIIPVFC